MIKILTYHWTHTDIMEYDINQLLSAGWELFTICECDSRLIATLKMKAT